MVSLFDSGIISFEDFLLSVERLGNTFAWRHNSMGIPFFIAVVDCFTILLARHLAGVSCCIDRTVHALWNMYFAYREGKNLFIYLFIYSFIYYLFIIYLLIIDSFIHLFIYHLLFIIYYYFLLIDWLFVCLFIFHLFIYHSFVHSFIHFFYKIQVKPKGFFYWVSAMNLKWNQN